MRFLRFIRSLFAWELIDRVGRVEYWENRVTGDRQARSHQISGRYHVKPNQDWLEGVVDNPREYAYRPKPPADQDKRRLGKPAPSKPVRM